jgi:hypothetical protein
MKEKLMKKPTKPSKTFIPVIPQYKVENYDSINLQHILDYFTKELNKYSYQVSIDEIELYVDFEASHDYADGIEISSNAAFRFYPRHGALYVDNKNYDKEMVEYKKDLKKHNSDIKMLKAHRELMEEKEKQIEIEMAKKVLAKYNIKIEV